MNEMRRNLGDTGVSNNKRIWNLYKIAGPFAGPVLYVYYTELEKLQDVGGGNHR